MIAGRVSRRVVMGRLESIEQLLKRIQALPLDDLHAFQADPRNGDAAESCLRRSLEALIDAGRHILAKGYGQGVSEYKEVASALYEQGALTEEEARLLGTLAGYRNRLVHFYDEVSAEELYEICTHQLADIKRIGSAYRRWLEQHPDKLDLPAGE